MNEDKRAASDRRSRPTSFLSAFRYRGQRKGFRRDGEAKNKYVDCLSGHTVGLLFLLISFFFADGFLTYFHLSNGAVEWNPLMNLALSVSLQCFYLVKCLLCALGAFFLAMHQNFAIGRLGLRVATAVYGVLVIYQVGLMVVYR
jgi:hypothetical protein